MTDLQYNHYKSLSDQDKYIINVAALMASAIDVSKLADIVQSKYNVTQKYLKEVLEKAAIAGLFESHTLGYGNRTEWEINFFVVIFLYPALKDYEKEWKKTRKQFDPYYHTLSQTRLFSELIYNLLYDEAKYPASEQDIFRRRGSYNWRAEPDISDILLFDAYESVLPRMSPTMLLPQFDNLESRFLRQLGPLKWMKDQFEKIRPRLPKSVMEELPNWNLRIAFLQGRLKEALEETQLKTLDEAHFIEGVKRLFERNVDDALLLFDKGMKVQRSTYRGRVLPVKPEFSLFHLLALSCSKPQTSASTFQKLLKLVTKKDASPIDFVFSAVAAFNLGDKTALQTAINHTKSYTGSFNQSLMGIITIPILYMADQKPDFATQKVFLNTVRVAFENGYGLLAYEAGFALTQWNRSEETVQLYEQIEKTFQHQPALSLLKKQEPWEQVLNSFLSFDKTQKGTTGDAKDAAKYRVLYFVNKDWTIVQPVLQTRTAKGWSKGRNIGIKTLGDGKVEGLTEQDRRIASHVRKYESGWGAPSYEFNDSVVKDLVGHPYLYLDGMVPVPIELLPAQPVLTVKKEIKGYTLSSNIKDASTRYQIIKETNTRYHFYELTNELQQLLQRVLTQKIVIPEQGKDKLIQVLSVFSARMSVQSDLLADEHSAVRTIPSDPRIRVQLLPFAGGLKAELFTKPFGEIPPYCKPGKGGANLFTNQQNEQLQTSRNLKKETEFATLLMNEIQSLESVDVTDELFTFEQPQDALELLEILLRHQDCAVVEWPEGVRFKLRSTAATEQLQLRIKSKTNWFELEGELRIDENTVVSLMKLMELTSLSNNRFIELGSGEFIALSKQLKKQLDDLRHYTAKGKDSLHLNPYASLAMGEAFEQELKVKTDKQWKAFQQKVQSSKTLTAAVPNNLQAELRGYQEEGFQWMARLAEWNAGACLADDMGLGKTVQALTVLLQRASQGPSVVICPMSVLPNWVNEVERFAPSLQIKTLGLGDRSSLFKSLQPNDLLLLTYGLLQSEVQALAEIEFATAVLDEAHTIKNVTTKTSQAAMKLKASFRLAMTGTPIQNHLGEIWNLFNFINPGLLGSLSQFTEHYVKNDDTSTRKQLKRLISPFLLRRTKAAVLDELPPKTEILMKVPLSTEERAFYEALRRNAIAKMEDSEEASGTKHLQALAEITKLRQACCNTALVDSSLQLASSKLSAFMELVGELRENNHRALVFSQFVGHLSLIRKALDKEKISYLYLDGSTPMKERADLVSRFQQGNDDLFLISLKAGGLGLNLTAADFIIHLDPWWNPAIEDQASDRAHRIGQSRPVTVYRLVAEDTIEEKILKLHATKRNLADTLLEGSDRAAKLSLKELMEILSEQ